MIIPCPECNLDMDESEFNELSDDRRWHDDEDTIVMHLSCVDPDKGHVILEFRNQLALIRWPNE